MWRLRIDGPNVYFFDVDAQLIERSIGASPGAAVG